MNLTGETITTARVVEIFHALDCATEKSRRIMRKSQDGDITPQVAADALNIIIGNLHAALAGEAREVAP